MPLLYSEGSRAFTRLQEETMKISTDHSILAWERSSGGELLAKSPDDFAASGTMVRWGQPSAFEMTNRGLRISLPVVRRERWYGSEEYLAVLNCGLETDFQKSAAIRLRKYRKRNDYYVIHGDAHRSVDTRLTTVETREFQDRERELVEISRAFEPESFGLKFQLQMGSGLRTFNFFCNPWRMGQSRSYTGHWTTNVCQSWGRSSLHG